MSSDSSSEGGGSESQQNTSPSQPASPRQVAAPAATTAGTSSHQQDVDTAPIAQIVIATISSLNLLCLFQQSTPQISSGKHLRAFDVPIFKGYSLDGADASAFLDSVDTIFTSAKTVEEDKTRYASLAFPVGPSAQTSYTEQRDLSLFRLATDLSSVLRYVLFTHAFSARFTTPLSRRYYL
jgi:hypothetical protein